MSERPPEESEQDGPMSVPDEDLPDDVRPSDDNPLAQPADDDVPDDILKDTSERRPLEDRQSGDDGDVVPDRDADHDAGHDADHDGDDGDD